MDHHNNTVDPQVVRQIPVVFRVAIGIHSSLKHSHGVCIFRWGNRVKEHVGTVPRGKIRILLCLKTEIKKMALTEIQD